MSDIDNKDLEKIVAVRLGSRARISNYQLEPFSETRSGLMGRHDSLSIDLELAGATRNLKFFVKRLPPDSVLREGVLDEWVFLEEVHFYSEVYPLMGSDDLGAKWSPACYLAKPDTLYLEDLRSQGYATRPNSIYDPETLKAAVSCLAHFHAGSMIAERRLAKRLDLAYPEAFREKIFTDVGKGGRSTKLGFETLELLADGFGLDGAQVPKILRRIYELVKPVSGGCNTLCHGDLWRGNLMFKNGTDGPECLLVDFQMLRYASPSLDLAMLLYVHATPETRATFETRLLEHYYATFRQAVLDAGITAPDYAEIADNYEARRIYGMVCGSLRWPAAIFAKLEDPRALESWYFETRVEIYRSLMNDDPAYKATMQTCLRELIAEAKRTDRTDRTDGASTLLS